MKIYKLGEEVLRKKCVPVEPEEINYEMRSLFLEMFDTMDEAEGVGLAAPQVGISKRFFVVTADDGIRRVFINPQIVYTSSTLSDYEEGCLSLPGFNEVIRRPEKVTCCAVNEFGKPFTLEADGLLARIIQHEYDHLEGILFIDRGDKDFAEKTEEQFKRRAQRSAEKAKLKAVKAARIAAKIAAKENKKNK